jgi:hypothetical protein
MARKQWLSVGELTLEGAVNSGGVTVLAENTSQLAIMATATGAPPSALAGYAYGCIYVRQSNGALYANTGGATSCTFSLVGTVAGLTSTYTELNTLAGVTAGTTLPSKAVVLDAAESLAWATTDATASETCTLTITDTRTGAGATGWAAKFDLEANVALGSYANACYGYLALGASGKVTGLGAGVCSETVLSAGCTDGTYAGLEIELGMPSGAKTGTQTSLLYLSVYGTDAATFDTNGYLFSLTGVTKGTGAVLADATSGATVRPVQMLRVHTPDGVRYLPLYSTVACAA